MVFDRIPRLQRSNTGRLQHTVASASWVYLWCVLAHFFFFFQAEDGIRDDLVTGVQTCALPISPNRIPTCCWEVISVDTIRELPESKGYNAILVAVDRLSKCIHAIPTITTVDSAGVAHLFLEHVWRHHGLLEAIISDRGSTFISNFSRELAALLNI